MDSERPVITLPLRRYSVSVPGHEPHVFATATAGKARYRAWRAYRDAGYRARFWSFAKRVTVRALGVAQS